MTEFFLFLYRFFNTHKAIFYAIIISTTLVFGFFATKIRFVENIMELLPKTDKSKDCAVAFGNIKVKDKIFIEVQALEGNTMSPEELGNALDEYIDLLRSRDSKGLIGSCLNKMDTDDLMNLVYYGMEALPCHISPDVYPILDQMLTEEMIDSVAQGKFKAPNLDLGTFNFMKGHIFSMDSTLVIAFASPGFDALDTRLGGDFEKLMSSCVKEFSKTHPECEVLYHGTVSEGTFNSRQIKKDLFLTLGLSLLLICILISLCFKKKRTLLQLLAPVLYGTLFALACVYWISGELSIIALAIGAIVLGVAMSYVLHVLTHHKYVDNVEDVIREQARPVCLGCLTTVGAFAGLLLTSSSLLKEFGIFASIALIGTTFASLAFLPQFFTKEDSDRNEKAFSIIGKINSYPLDRNVPVIVALVIVAIAAIIFSGKVEFDSDLSHIGYREPKIVRAENNYFEKVNRGNFSMFYAAHSDNLEDAIAKNRVLSEVLDSLKAEGVIDSYSGTDGILIPEEEQIRNIEAWKEYWTPERTSRTYRILRNAAAKYGWASTGFDIPETFKLMAEADYAPTSLYNAGVIPEALMCNYVEENEDGWLVFTNVMMDRAQWKKVNDIVTLKPGIVVLDPFYYTGDMVEIIHDDFNKVLLVSSLFVFIVLLLSFRSIILSIIAFLPMGLSWYIVQGLMAIFGIDFNLINIMISTFIFGIGVDYSIFVMEGLIARAKYNSHRLLVCHKVAIFFSAATLLIVTGSLLFATSPAIYSIGISTIIGMSSTILITYALQPLLFRVLQKFPRLSAIALHTK